MTQEQKCEIKDCDNKYFARKMCNKHYIRWYKHGDASIILRSQRKLNKTHGKHGTKEYNAWQSMLQRCNNPNSQIYSYYGGREIKVCAEWLDFSKFYKDMGNAPGGLTLDRINNDGNYEPSNCRWTTHREQMRNRSNTVLSAETKKRLKQMYALGLTPMEISERTGFNKTTIGNVFYRR